MEVCQIEQYSDAEWCDDLSSDAYFAKVLTWAGWRPARQELEWSRIRETVLQKPLSEMGSHTVPYSLPWQRNWYALLASHLRTNRITAADFVTSLRRMGREDAKRTLLRVVHSSEEKIVECWLRDVVRLPAFPIDGRVREVLKRFHIPDDSDLVVECAERLGIPAREFARAVYENAEEL